MRKRRLISLSLLMSGLLFSTPKYSNVMASETSSGQVSSISEIDSIIEFLPGQSTANDVYQELLEASITLKAKSHTSPGADSNITYGAEKEASSFLITRAMGPGNEMMKFFFVRESDAFKRDFIKRFIGGSSREKSVVDIHGVQHALKFSEIVHLKRDVDLLSGDQLNERLEKIIDLMGKSPFSHLTKLERKKLFKRQHSGQRFAFDSFYSQWTAILGKAQKYVGNAHGTGVDGWEINFKPMDTYGEFEEMIKWFKETLKNAGKLFQAPGHQRIVFPQPQFEHLQGNQEAAAKELWQQKTSEMFRSIQAYIIVRGLVGGTGIERGNYKIPHHDANLLIGGVFTGDWGGQTRDSGRGPIRYDKPGRFVPDTFSVELRAGTKDAKVQQFIEQVATARIATNQLGDLANLNGYELYPRSLRNLLHDSYELNARSIDKLAKQLHQRFGVSEKVASRFIMASTFRVAGQNSKQIINRGYNIPVWLWENAPYMKGKAQLLKLETRRYIEKVAFTTDAVEIKAALQRWTKNVRISESIENYLRPKAIVENMAELAKVRPTGRVDVNKIDLGIEYSGRFTNAYGTEMLPERGVDGQQVWLNTTDGMTPHERKQAIKRMSLALGKALNDGRAVPVYDASTAGAHGHGLSIAFKFKDKHGRKWRAEWDGVARNYTANGEVVPGSMRGGHIEIVTPKFNPTYEEMSAVYKAMESEGIIPSLRAGGGHINIDLAPFAGKPKQLARFLTLFHEHRGIMSFMFQNINRSAAAEAVEVSETLRTKLKNFRGTETELKQLLYNERYFNQRIGRKTRNMQIDMSAYFQDVIPARYIHEDFDMKNPTDPWREQFRVEPHIRKMEMRMFDAPLDVFESSMQIKLVRALMNAALNETTPLSGKVQTVDHLDYIENYDKAEAHLEKMCEALGLNAKEYKIFLSRAAVQGKQAASGRFFRTYEDKIELFGWKQSTEGWGEALKNPRSSSRAIGSEGRHWSGTPSAMAEEFRQTRVEAAQQAENARAHHTPSSRTRPALQMSVNCRQVFGM